MADLPNLPNPTKPADGVAKGMKGSFKRLAAFAKKRPAIVALMVGAVVLVVWAIRRRGGFGTGAAERRLGEEDPLLELGASGVPIEEDLGGFIPGVFPAPMPYYEPSPYPGYTPSPAYQDIEYGAAGAVQSSLSDTGLLDFLRLAREAESGIEAPVAYGPESGFISKLRTVPYEELFKLIPGGTYDRPGSYLVAPGEYRLGQSAIEDLARVRAFAPTLTAPKTEPRQVFSTIRQRAAAVLPKLAPSPTGTPTSGAKPRALQIQSNIPV